MTDERPFTFQDCPDPQACRAAMRPLLAPGMDWSEVHCGRCGCQGIVRHADMDPAPAPDAPEPEPTPSQAAPDAEADGDAANAAAGGKR